MGCDIHAYTEIKKDGIWVSAEPKVKNPYYNPEEDCNEPEYTLADLAISRNYSLFYVLAGVRNGSNKIKPIAVEQGLPKNVSKPVKEQSDAWGTDGHSHSYLGCDELIDWLKEVKPKKIEALLLNKPDAHYDYVEEPLTNIINKMLSYGYSPENTRLVFWFDN